MSGKYFAFILLILFSILSIQSCEKDNIPASVNIRLKQIANEKQVIIDGYIGVFFENFRSQLQKYFDEKKYNNLLNLITVNHYNNLHTIVPQALFDKNNIKNYLKFNNSLLKNDEYLYDTIKINDCINIFVPIKFNISNLQQHSKKVTQKHYTTNLINKVFKKSNFLVG